MEWEHRRLAAIADEGRGSTDLERRLTRAAVGCDCSQIQSAYKRNQKNFDLHLISYGAGDPLLAGLAEILPPPITSATAIAPATTMLQFRDGYRQLLDDGCLQHLTIVALDIRTA